MEAVIKTQYEILSQLKNNFNSYKNDTSKVSQYLSGLDIGGTISSFIKGFDLQRLISSYVTDWRFGTLSNDVISLIVFSSIFIMVWILCWSLSAYIRARNCIVTCDWDEEPNLRPRVGQTAVIKISFIPPPGPESVRDLLQQISIQIMLGQEDVVLEKDARDSDGSILIKFKIQKAGKYEVYIWFNGFPICGTPFSKIVEPETMDPDQARMTEKNPIVLTLGRQRKVEIVPIDKNGNRCSATHDDLLRLSIDIRKLKQVDPDQEGDQIVTSEIISSFDLRDVIHKANSNDIYTYTVIELYLKATEMGVYFMKLLYNDLPLPFEEFEIISISAQEQKAILQKEFQEWRSTTCATFKAMWTPNEDTLEINGNEVDKKIIVELSPRFFYFKEYLGDGPLTSRLATFRICPLTKVKAVLIEKSLDGDSYSLEILDRMRDKAEKIKMNGSDARMFIVLVSSFESSDEDTRPNLEKKQACLYRGLREYYLEQNFPRISYKILKIRKTELLDSSLLETRDFTREDWGKPFIVSFFGEQVKPDVQAWVEWSESLLQSFFENNPHGMFCYLGSGCSSLVHPNPHRNIRWTLEHYELAGKIVGKYVVETALDVDEGNMKYFANVRFTRSFLAQILSLRPTYKHLELDDPDVYMSTVHPILSQNVTGMNLMFTGPFYDRYGTMHIRELIPNGSSVPVTDVNKVAYLNALAEYRLAENVQLEVKAFVSGLALVIPEDWLMNFDENELEILLCGSSNFMVRDIRLHHLGSGVEWNPSIARIKEWLWRSLQEMSPLDIGRFLQFTTGSCRLPQGGFAELKPRLKISISCLYGQLPSANRTLHQLFLTDHPNYQEFAYALTAAMRGNDYNANNTI